MALSAGSTIKRCPVQDSLCCGSVARQAVDAAFARSRDAPLLDDYVKGAERLDMRVADGYPHATVHDVRRTATTHMSKHGLGKEVRIFQQNRPIADLRQRLLPAI